MAHRQKRSTLLLLVPFAGLAIWYCLPRHHFFSFYDSTGVSSAAPGIPGPSGPVVDRLMDRPTKFLGQAITIEGNVRTVPATRVFSLVEPGSSRPLLVIVLGSPPPLRPDAEVQVQGHIETLDVTTMQRRFGVDLAPERIGNWDGKPVLIGERVQLRHTPRTR